VAYAYAYFGSVRDVFDNWTGFGNASATNKGTSTAAIWTNGTATSTIASSSSYSSTPVASTPSSNPVPSTPSYSSYGGYLYRKFVLPPITGYTSYHSSSSYKYLMWKSSTQA
jgi:hypothetical protein